MKDKASKNAKDDKNLHLTRQFMVSGLISVILIVTFATIRGYYSLRTHSVRNISEVVALRIKGVNSLASQAASSEKSGLKICNPAAEGFKYLGSDPLH